MVRSIELIRDILEKKVTERPVISTWSITSRSIINTEKIQLFYEKLCKLSEPDLLVYDPYPYFFLADFVYPHKKILWDLKKIDPFSDSYEFRFGKITELEHLENYAIEFEYSFLKDVQRVLLEINKNVKCSVSLVLPSPLLMVQLLTKVNLDYWLRKDPSRLSRAIKPFYDLLFEYAIIPIEEEIESIFYLVPFISVANDNGLSKEIYLLRGWKIDKSFLSRLWQKNDIFIIKHVENPNSDPTIIQVFENTLPHGFINWNYEENGPNLFDEKISIHSPVVGGMFTQDIKEENETKIFQSLKAFNENFSLDGFIYGTGTFLDSDINLKFVKKINKKVKNFIFKKNNL